MAPIFTLVPRGRRATTAPVFGTSRTSATSQPTLASPDAAASGLSADLSSLAFLSCTSARSFLSPLSFLSATFVGRRRLDGGRERRVVRDGIARVLVRDARGGHAGEVRLQAARDALEVADGRRLADLPAEAARGKARGGDERQLAGLAFGGRARRELLEVRSDDVVERGDAAAVLALLRLAVGGLAGQDRTTEHAHLRCAAGDRGGGRGGGACRRRGRGDLGGRSREARRDRVRRGAARWPTRTRQPLRRAADSPGAFGPSFTPMMRGQATPMTKPTAAITPTLHPGRAVPIRRRHINCERPVLAHWSSRSTKKPSSGRNTL